MENALTAVSSMIIDTYLTIVSACLYLVFSTQQQMDQLQQLPLHVDFHVKPAETMTLVILVKKGQQLELSMETGVLPSKDSSKTIKRLQGNAQVFAVNAYHLLIALLVRMDMI